MRANREAVTSALHYHLHLADTLRYFIPRADGTPPAQRPDNRLFSRGFVSPATILSTAWDVANLTDAVGYMDYDDVLLLSQTYASQQSYEHQAEQVGQLIYTRLFDEGPQGIYSTATSPTCKTSSRRSGTASVNSWQATTRRLPTSNRPRPPIPSVCRRSVAACSCAKSSRTAQFHTWAKSSGDLLV